MTDIDLIVKSKIKMVIPEMSVAGEVSAVLNKHANAWMKQGADRARQNGRRTVQAKDLHIEVAKLKSKVDLIVKSKVKSAVPEMSVAGEAPAALNMKALETLHVAAQRAKLNGRKTVQAKDL
jgi:histone H3/H4